MISAVDKHLLTLYFLQLIVPDSGIVKGNIFGFGDETSLPYASSWSEVSGSLALSTQGDALAVYCKPTESAFNFLGALSFSGPWVSTGFSSTNGALPPGLEEANTALSHYDNYQYVGPTSGGRNGLVSAISNENNWKGSNTAEFVVFDPTFTVTSGDGSDITPFGDGSDTTPSGGSPDDESAAAHSRISILCPFIALFMLNMIIHV